MSYDIIENDLKIKNVFEKCPDDSKYEVMGNLNELRNVTIF